MLLTLAYDPGTSLTKAIYAIDEGPPQLITMPPGAIRLAAEGRDGLVQRCELEPFAKPQDLAWFSFKKTKGDCFAVGDLARSYAASASIHELKYEASEYKIVGLVGAIARQERLPEGFDLDLAVLLPLAEYRDGHKLRDKVEADLKRVWWRGQWPLRVNLQRWRCYPEGSGRILAYLDEVGRDAFQEQQVLVTMLGHRNVSLLWFEEGKFNQASESTDELGFYAFLDTIQRYVSGYSHQDFLDAMEVRQVEPEDLEAPLAGDEGPQERLFIDARQMAARRVSSRDNIQTERAELERAMGLARQEYLTRLRQWFDERTGSHAWHKVFFLGGAYQFFEDEVKGWIDWSSSPPQLGRATAAVAAALGLMPRQRRLLGARLHDVYGLFDYFRAAIPAQEHHG
jgi:hypothetical protein